MKHISILVPKGGILGSIEGPYKVFNEINQIMEQMGKDRLFNIELVGLSLETSLSEGAFTVKSSSTIANVQKTDLVIIPAFHGDLPVMLEANKDFIPWINDQYAKGAEVASLCMGAFLFASTGLLNGKKCATHWIAANEFRTMFPEVNLVAEKIITDEHGMYSSGGAYSWLNLVLYLIEKYAGRQVAVLCAKIFEIEIDRDSQASFMIFRGQKEHEDESVKKAQEYIEQNFQDRITVDQLASKFAIGRRNLERRFKKATANTVIEYIQRVKIEVAKLSLESSKENVNEIMYKVGYNDTKAFRTTFKKITGLSPIQYKNKYNREIVAQS